MKEEQPKIEPSHEEKKGDEPKSKILEQFMVNPYGNLSANI